MPPQSGHANPIAPDLDRYYESIREIFNQTIESQKSGDISGSITGFFGALLALSLVPLLPATCYFLEKHFRVLTNFKIRTWHPPVESFVFWYVLMAFTFGTSLAIAASISNKREKNRTNTWLDPSRMRFALCYSVVSELEKYRMNRLPAHAEKALGYWKSLLNSLSRFLHLVPSMTYDYQGMVFIDEHVHWIGSADAKKYPLTFPWLRLEPTSQLILDGFEQIPFKLSDRIRDKKDLSEVTELLRRLARYLYSIIPEVSDIDAVNSEQLRTYGEDQLLQFANRINELSEFKSEPLPLSKKSVWSERVKVAFSFLLCLYAHDNAVLRFFVWWITVQVAIVSSLRFIDSLFPFKIDSAIISILVVTPLLVAAAALAFSRSAQLRQ